MGKEYRRNWTRKWRASLSEEAKESIRKKQREQKRLWYAQLSAADKEKLIAQHRAYRATVIGRTVCRKSVAKWDKNNPVKKALISSIRRSRLLQRTPKWLTSDDYWMMEEIYDLAARRTALRVGGHKWHVDHIIPLQGKLVSGLHVPFNLRVLPAVENRRKHARFSP